LSLDFGMNNVVDGPVCPKIPDKDFVYWLDLLNLKRECLGKSVWKLGNDKKRAILPDMGKIALNYYSFINLAFEIRLPSFEKPASI
jgi:hypothetical protein